MLKRLIPLIFSPVFMRKVFTILLVVALVMFLQDFLGLILITFIFGYLSLEVAEFLRSVILSQSKKTKNTFWKGLEQYASVNVLVTLLYIFFIIMIIWLVVSIFPKIAWEIEKLVQQAPQLAHHAQGLLERLEHSTGIYIGAQDLVQQSFKAFNLQNTGEEVLKYIRDTGGVLLKFMLGLIMSYIFIIDRKDIFSFFERMKHGNFAFIYQEFQYISDKVISGFGRVFKAQGIIALVNAMLTTLGLLMIGYFFPAGHFPYIFTLSLIVFIFGFIPVFGTFLSGLPIVIIGYGVGGIPMVIAIILMISLIHAIEAYILNPKIVSSYMHFPVFITFATLIVAEHIFGMIGLLIGVPLLAILISIFDDLDAYISHIKTEYAKRSGECPTIPSK